MTEAGLAKVREAQENGEWEAAIAREDTSSLPDDLERALERNGAAQANFEKLPASQKKQFLYWIMSAKTDKTRQKTHPGNGCAGGKEQTLGREVKRIPSPASLAKFRHSVPSQVSIPETEWEYVAPRLMERGFERNEYLVSAGEVADNFYFIIAGLVRFFLYHEDGKEFNKNFAMENGFAGLSIRSCWERHADTTSRPWKRQIRSCCQTDCCVNSTSDIRAGSGLAAGMPKTWPWSRKRAKKSLLLDSLETRYRRVYDRISRPGGSYPPISYCLLLRRHGCCTISNPKKNNLG